MDDLAKDEVLAAISADRSLASALLFPHRHRQASPAFHVQIMDLWRSADRLVLIEAFRAGAKTTLSEEFLLIEALFENFHYTLIFGETYTKACERIASMKHELLTNRKIISLFGKQKGDKWAENKIVMQNGVAIEAHGWEEEIRGYLHFDWRPDRAYLDDIENKESVRNTLIVDANWRKLHMELIPALDVEFGKVRMTGTPLADDCMVRRAAASSEWVHGFFPVADGDIDNPATKSSWESRFPIEWIRKTRDHLSSEGMLREFNQEYMLIPTGTQGKPFTEDMLRFEDIAPKMYSPRVAIFDPARTVEVKTSDQTGRVVVSKIGTRIYVHESGGEYWQPDEIVGGAFEASDRHDDCEVAIEKNSLDNWLLQPIRARMLLLGRTLKLRVLQAPQDRDKAQFIMGLRPFFVAGDIILVGGRAKHQQLVSQILNFPSGKKDILNALAYVLRVFSGVPVYGDFGEQNRVEGYVPSRNAVFILGANASGTDTCAVLCALDGAYLTVMADWCSPLVPSDAIPDITRLIRAMWPGKTIQAWCPADVFDQVGRNPLITALKSNGMKPARAEASIMNRGSLSPLLRTEIKGRRLLLVDANAHGTMQGLSAGYNWQVKPGGERMADPENNSARVLIEALECLTTALNKPNVAEIHKTNAVNVNGVAYMSALGK